MFRIDATKLFSYALFDMNSNQADMALTQRQQL